MVLRYVADCCNVLTALLVCSQSERSDAESQRRCGAMRRAFCRSLGGSGRVQRRMHDIGTAVGHADFRCNRQRRRQQQLAHLPRDRRELGTAADPLEHRTCACVCVRMRVCVCVCVWSVCRY